MSSLPSAYQGYYEPQPRHRAERGSRIQPWVYVMTLMLMLLSGVLGYGLGSL